MFSVEQGCATSPIGIVNIKDLILFASFAGSQVQHPKWCEITKAGKIHKVVVVLVSCVGVKEYMENQSAFPQCDNIFEQVRWQTKIPLNKKKWLTGEMFFFFKMSVNG